MKQLRRFIALAKGSLRIFAKAVATATCLSVVHNWRAALIIADEVELTVHVGASLDTPSDVRCAVVESKEDVAGRGRGNSHRNISVDGP